VKPVYSTPTGDRVATFNPATAEFDDLELGGPVAIEVGVACSDEISPITTAGVAATLRAPCGISLSEVRASLTTAAATGTFTVDVLVGGASILSTLLTIDATETTSTTATTPPVIDTPAISDDAEIEIEITDTADDTATGLKVWLKGVRT
jgi:hypothetical protein